METKHKSDNGAYMHRKKGYHLQCGCGHSFMTQRGFPSVECKKCNTLHYWTGKRYIANKVLAEVERKESKWVATKPELLHCTTPGCNKKIVVGPNTKEKECYRCGAIYNRTADGWDKVKAEVKTEVKTFADLVPQKVGKKKKFVLAN